MHILWLVKTVLPQAAAACGLAGASDVSGSWLTGQLAALRPHGELRLTVACTDARQKASLQGEQDGVSYRILPGADGFAALLQTEQPDLVHIWGTESPEAAAMQDAAADVFWPQARTAAVRDAAIRKACLPYIEQLRPLYPHGTEVRTRRDWRLFRWMMQTFGPKFTLWAASRR